MKREDELLREACAEIAREETEALNRSLTLEEIRRAESVFQEHRETALRKIRGYRAAARKRYLYAVAAVILLTGGALLAWKRTPPDNPPAAQPLSTVAPYYTALPTETPISAPMETPAPTEAPTSAPTETSVPTETPKPDITAPEGWTGLYFPQTIPEGYELKYLAQEDGRHTAAYARDGREMLFTEYDSVQAIQVEADGESRYTALPDGSIALRTETDAGVTLIWDKDGRTLTVACEEADPEEIAGSVKKIPEK